jgi:hypothetical protein
MGSESTHSSFRYISPLSPEHTCLLQQHGQPWLSLRLRSLIASKAYTPKAMDATGLDAAHNALVPKTPKRLAPNCVQYAYLPVAGYGIFVSSHGAWRSL